MNAVCRLFVVPEGIFSAKTMGRVFWWLMSEQGESGSEKVDICAYSSERWYRPPPTLHLQCPQNAWLVAHISPDKKVSKGCLFSKQWRIHTHTHSSEAHNERDRLFCLGQAWDAVNIKPPLQAICFYSAKSWITRLIVLIIQCVFALVWPHHPPSRTASEWRWQKKKVKSWNVGADGQQWRHEHLIQPYISCKFAFTFIFCPRTSPQLR